MSLVFLDSNILVYVFAEDWRQARATALLRAGGMIGVQSLNELANVLRRKWHWEWPQVREAVGYVRRYCPYPAILDDKVQDDGLRLAERYKLSVYDGMIAAAAIATDSEILYSEDMHAGLVIDGRLRIVNPFA